MSGPKQDQPVTLEDWLVRLRTHEDRIYVREKVHGKWDAVPLSSLPPERWGYWVAFWLNKGMVPHYMLKQPREDT